MLTTLSVPESEVARKRPNFYVSGLGETPYMGSVNLRDLQQCLGHEPSDQEVDQEFLRQSRLFHSRQEHALWVKHGKLLRKFGDTLWHFYGYVKQGRSYLYLSTEFLALSESHDFWSLLGVVATHLGFSIETMDEEIESNHSWRVDEFHEKIPGSDKYGPWHGRLVRQVDVYVEIYKARLGTVRHHIDEFERLMRKHKDELERYRVAVL